MGATDLAAGVAGVAAETAFTGALLGTLAEAGAGTGAFAGALAWGLLTGFSSRVGRIGGLYSKACLGSCGACAAPFEPKGGCSGRRIVATTSSAGASLVLSLAWCYVGRVRKSEIGAQTKHCSKP